MIFLKKSIGAFAICCLLIINKSGDAKTITAAFQLTEIREESTHQSHGTIYYKPGTALTVRVTSPLDQWMIFKGDTLSIYYPDDNKLIKVPSQGGDVTLPIFQLLINSDLEDLGFVQAGYALYETQVENGKITAVWKPPESALRILGDVIVNYIHDSLMSIEAFDPKDRVVSRQYYSDYIESGGKLFPRNLEVTKYGKLDSLFEEIRLQDVVFEVEIPEENINPAIPDSVATTIMEW